MNTSLKALFFVFIAFSFVSGAAAQTHSQKEQKFMSWFVTLHALAGCPDLIENWEYDVMEAVLEMREKEIGGPRGLPPQNKHPLTAHAAKFSCDMPQFQQEAVKMRNLAAYMWRYYYIAYQGAPACKNILLFEDTQSFTAEFDQHIKGHIERTLGAQVNTEISSKAAPLASDLEKLCTDTDVQRLNVRSDIFKNLLRAPSEQRDDMARKTSWQTRNFRSFFGAPIQKGNVQFVDFAPIQAKRGTMLENSSTRIVMQGHIGEKEIPYSIQMTAEGDMQIGVRSKERLNALSDNIMYEPMVEILNPRTNQMQIIITEKTQDQGLGIDETYFARGALDILKDADPLSILYIRFARVKTSVFDGSVKGDFVTPIARKGTNLAGAVAIPDLIKAHNYAFAPDEQDLNQRGHVAQVAGFGQ